MPYTETQKPARGALDLSDRSIKHKRQGDGV